MIESNDQGMTVRTQAQLLTDFGFLASSKNVFARFDAEVSVRFKGILRTNNNIKLVIPNDLKI